MIRRFIKFARVKDCLPIIAASTALNLKSQKKIDWLDHQGPDGKHWKILWIDVPKLEYWAAIRGAAFSPTLKAGLQRWTIEVKNTMEGQD